MKCLVAVFCLARGLSLIAQTTTGKPAIADQDDYSAAMKEIAARNAALRKSLGTTPSEAAAAVAAVRLEAIFKNVQAYWEAKNVEDATAQSKKAVAALQDIAKSLSAHDIPAVNAASQMLAGTCMSCHDAHRARLTDGFYRIK
jgi:cytochrome c556